MHYSTLRHKQFWADAAQLLLTPPFSPPPVSAAASHDDDDHDHHHYSFLTSFLFCPSFSPSVLSSCPAFLASLIASLLTTTAPAPDPDAAPAPAPALAPRGHPRRPTGKLPMSDSIEWPTLGSRMGVTVSSTIPCSAPRNMNEFIRHTTSNF